MKKTIALLMTLALLVSAVALPAMAEETAGAVDQVTSATQNGRNDQTAKGGRGGSRQMPGQNGQNSQTPGNGMTPQMPGQNGQNGQTPGVGNGRRNKGVPGLNGQAARGGKQLIFDQLLAEGVITQEVYDAITAWMNAKMQPQADSADPAEGSEPPALPEDADAQADSAQAQLLKSLLDSGVITREQYDLLAGAQPPAPAEPAVN